MGGVTRVGDKCTGHDACPPVALASGSPTVSIEGRPVGRVGDPYEAHGCKDHPSHVGTIASGAAHVFVDGKAVGRVGDPVSCGGTVAEGSSTVAIGDNGGEEYAAKARAELTKLLVEKSIRATDADVIIPYLPDIARAMAQKDEDADNRKGWELLAPMLEKWLSGQAFIIKSDNIKDPSVSRYVIPVEWDWLMKFDRFYMAYKYAVNPDVVLGDFGRAELVRLLKEYDGGELWKNGGSFDFSASPKKNWYANAFNQRNVGRSLVSVDGLDICLAAHSIMLMAAGTIEPPEEGSEVRSIKVEKLYAFVEDRFNFAEDNAVAEKVGLRYWSKEKLSFSIYKQKDDDSYVWLENASFRHFQETYNTGRDFEILSEFHQCDEFPGYFFMAK